MVCLEFGSVCILFWNDYLLNLYPVKHICRKYRDINQILKMKVNVWPYQTYIGSLKITSPRHSDCSKSVCVIWIYENGLYSNTQSTHVSTLSLERVKYNQSLNSFWIIVNIFHETFTKGIAVLTPVVVRAW